MRGYDPVEVNRMRILVGRMGRQELLRPKAQGPEQEQVRLRWFHPQGYRTPVPEPPVVPSLAPLTVTPQPVTRLWGRILQKRLIRAAPRENTRQGSWRCGRPECRACMYMVQGRTVIGENGHEWRLRGSMSCDDKDAIYAIACRKCGRLGVGETGDLRGRIVHYIDGIRKQSSEGSILQHFHGHDLWHMSFTILEALRPELRQAVRPAIRLRLENVWQNRLGATLNTKKVLRPSFSGWTASKRRRLTHED